MCEVERCLPSPEKDAESEEFVRKAVLVSSNDYRCWICLGHMCQSLAWKALVPVKLLDKPGPQDELSPEILNYHPPPADIRRFEELNQEAAQYFQRAIALAPERPDPYVHRAGYIGVSNFYNTLYEYYRGMAKLDTAAAMACVASPSAIADFRRAARLNGKDYNLTGYAAYQDILLAMGKVKLPLATNESMIDKVSDPVRRDINEAMLHLENLSKDADKKIALGALEWHGFLSVTLSRWSTATADFRRAIAIDPMRESLWDMLLASLFETPGASNEFLTACETRLKYEESAKNHLLLAKAEFRQLKYNEAKAHIDAALKLEPSNIVAQIAQLAVSIRQITNGITLARSDVFLTSCMEAVQNMTEGKEKDARSRDVILNFSILCGLAQTEEGDENAQRLLNKVLEKRPNDEDALKIREALK